MTSPQPVQKQMPFKYQLLAGGIAGTSEILMMYPLDVIKTRLQIQHGKSSVGLIGSFQQIIKSEGFGALYRGIIPPIMMEAPKRAIKFACQDRYLQMLKGDIQNKYLLASAAGGLAGATESVLVTPFDLIKVNLQDPSKKHLYKGTMDCVSQLYQANGLVGFSRGFESCFWRHFLWSFFYFGSISYLKDTSGVQSLRKQANTQFVDFCVGTVSATLATFVNTPFDVAKSRIQAQTAGRVPWCWPLMYKVASQESLGALWKGFVPKVVRLGPGGGIMLVVYGGITDYIRVNWMK